jgi:ABC-type glycerol-3-phosphate transport system substrate-binding protein
LSPRDLLELMQQYSDYQLFSASAIMDIPSYLLLTYGIEFLDWETGVCHFESEEFLDLLAVLKAIPEHSELGQYYGLSRNHYANKRILFALADISSLMDYKYLMTNLGDADVSFIRGLDISDNLGAEIMSQGGDYAISGRSKHKDGAWAFIEFVHSREQLYYFPTNIDKLEKKLTQEFMRVQERFEGANPGFYLARTLEDGEMLYIYSLTQEDLDALKKLINSAEMNEINYGTDLEILNIMLGEVQAYLAGDKTAEETAAIIQSRVQLMMYEMQ